MRLLSGLDFERGFIAVETSYESIFDAVDVEEIAAQLFNELIIIGVDDQLDAGSRFRSELFKYAAQLIGGTRDRTRVVDFRRALDLRIGMNRSDRRCRTLGF